MTEALVAALPAPHPEALTVYCFGPGPGESIVVALPDARWIVVDSCREDGANVPLLLLRRFGVERLAIAALTHPDADHYRGFNEILGCFATDKIWAFPFALTRRQILAKLARRNPHDHRWADLAETLHGLERAMSENRATHVNALQSRAVGDAIVHCVAPSPADMAYEQRALGEVIEKVLGGAAITDDDVHLLRGQKLDGSGNGLSLALVIEWSGLRICLGGDVAAPADPDRGWNGALSYVTAEGRADLFEDHVLVKTAHHASQHAFSEALYARLARNVRPIALVTPFKGGRHPPPHARTLRRLRESCARLGVTAEPGVGWPALRRADWSEDPRTDDESACCVVAVCLPGGDVSLAAHGRGRAFA